MWKHLLLGICLCGNRALAAPDYGNLAAGSGIVSPNRGQINMAGPIRGERGMVGPIRGQMDMAEPIRGQRGMNGPIRDPRPMNRAMPGKAGKGGPKAQKDLYIMEYGAMGGPMSGPPWGIGNQYYGNYGYGGPTYPMYGPIAIFGDEKRKKSGKGQSS